MVPVPPKLPIMRLLRSSVNVSVPSVTDGYMHVFLPLTTASVCANVLVEPSPVPYASPVVCVNDESSALSCQRGSGQCRPCCPQPCRCVVLQTICLDQT